MEGLKNVIAKVSLAALSPQLFRPFGDGFFFKLSEKKPFLDQFSPVSKGMGKT